jgi:hypothetical protein
MAFFQDSVTAKVWDFNVDVVATETAGVWSFATAEGAPIATAPTTLQPYTIPAPTVPLAQQAATLLAAALAAGLELTSTGTPTLNATYAMDPVSTAQIFQIGLYASQFGDFPSGGATQPYPDVTGAQHVFSVAQFIAFLKVVAPLVSALETQAGIMAQGGTPVWSSQAATIA